MEKRNPKLKNYVEKDVDEPPVNSSLQNKKSDSELIKLTPLEKLTFDMKNSEHSSQFSSNNKNLQNTFSVIKELENEDDPKTLNKNTASQISLKAETLSKSDSQTSNKFYHGRTQLNDVVPTSNSLNDNPKFASQTLNLSINSNKKDSTDFFSEKLVDF